ncbi:PfkB family carbohydrate kinase [Rhabdobacter roseus]|uniref:Sugar/nucleoside kinase (Ribokinase family) n=1 Tax=Rhabdobacter roseus TaxID=1655419 RepID=A0A840TTL9_9BACT|nr:PfkB family carbohydrate kinase [Rhabdobacter roseus]MBB5286624.1 sugar/nucleoside kinase (ribokinase family) [Rhabdobacter roseus]
MYDICTIGHITLDKVVTSQSVTYMPGGTSFYFSKAIQPFNLRYTLVTALGTQESYIVDDLRAASIPVHVLPSAFTVHFENIYSHNQDHREQNVLHKAAPFAVDHMPELSARVFHLGPLLSDDIPVALITKLAAQAEVSLDIQGYLRYVQDQKVYHRDWADKEEALPYITYLKANEFEMQAVTGHQNVQAGARYLAERGVREVIITLGSKGSVIYSNGTFHEIPAYRPEAIVDATGCGDTYMAGYLLQRINGQSIREAGEFGAAMATLKIESSGPFTGQPDQVEHVIRHGTFTPDTSAPVFE